MSSTITYQEISAAIAAILTRHPQFEKVFQKFERLPWHPHKSGMLKKLSNGDCMLVERSRINSNLDIVFKTVGEFEE